MRNGLARCLVMLPVVAALLSGACSRSESDEAANPNAAASKAAKPGASPAASPAAAAKPDESSAAESVAAAVPLLIYCAQEVRAPMEEIVQDIRTSLGLDCRLEYGGAPDLLSKITRMRQADIFVANHSDYLEMAQREGLVKPEDIKTLAYLEPGLLVAKGNPKGIKGLEDFWRAGDRNSRLTIGLADPEKCGLGLITQRIFEENKMSWAGIEQNCQLKVAAEHLLIMPASAHVFDLCIVRHAEAAKAAAACDFIPIPPKQNVLSVVAAAALSTSKHGQEARQAVEHMAGKSGRAVFKSLKYKLEVDPVLLATAKQKPGLALDAQGYIRDWLALPPIQVGPEAATPTEDVQRKLLDKEYFANQKSVKPTEKMAVKVGAGELTWEPVASGRSTWNFQPPDKSNYVFFGCTYLIVQDDIPDVALCVGARESSLWWLDGKEVIKAIPGKDGEWKSAPMTLTKGVHFLRLGVVRSPGDTWVSVRFTDKKNQSVDAIRVSLSPNPPQDGKPKSGG